MKRFIVALMVLGLCFMLVSLPTQAASTRTIPFKTRTVIAHEVVSAQGADVFYLSGYANAASAVFGLYDAATLDDTATTNCKFEGGEATQWDSIVPVDFGPDGLRFNTGLTVVTSGAYISIVYR